MSHTQTPANSPRRSFLKWCTHGLGVIFGALLGAPAIAYLLDARNRPAPAGEFKTVARLDELQVNVPHQVVIRDVRRDAWTIHPNDVIGRVWLLRREDGHVDAYTTICPHLGCSVNFEAKDRQFLCPCHGGTFDLQGHRLEQAGQINPAPRGMDLLVCRIDPANKDLLQVKYQNFVKGKEALVPVK